MKLPVSLDHKQLLDQQIVKMYFEQQQGNT